LLLTLRLVEGIWAFGLTVAVMVIAIVGPGELAVGLYGLYLAVISAVLGSVLVRRLISARHPEARAALFGDQGYHPTMIYQLPPQLVDQGLAVLMLFCGILATMMWPGWAVLILVIFVISPEMNRRALGVSAGVPLWISILWIAVPIVSAAWVANYLLEPLWEGPGTWATTLWAFAGLMMLFGPPVAWLAGFWRMNCSDIRAVSSLGRDSPGN
jgi:hypothetical protein